METNSQVSEYYTSVQSGKSSDGGGGLNTVEWRTQRRDVHCKVEVSIGGGEECIIVEDTVVMVNSVWWRTVLVNSI